MPIGFFKGDGAEIRIQLDRPEGPYYPGERIEASFTLQVDKELKVRQFRAGLLAWEQYTSEDSDGDQQTRTTRNDYVAQDVFMDNEIIYSGNYRTYHSSWQIPADAFPPYQSETIRAGWLVKATLDLGMKKDINDEYPLPLIVPLDNQIEQPGLFGESSHPDKVDMKFWLLRTGWVEGESLEGKLIVNPKEKLEANEVRLRLGRNEKVHAPRTRISSSAWLSKEQVEGKTRFQPNQVVEFPFSLRLPELQCPSRQTEATTVTYTLEAGLSRRLWKDYTVRTEITIFNGRKSG